MAGTNTFIKQFPYSLGQLKPGGTGVSLPLTANINPVLADPNTTVNRNAFPWLRIRAAPGNATLIYICTNASAPDTTNFTNVLDILSAGGLFERVSDQNIMAVLLNSYFVGAGNTTDYAIAMVGDI